MSGVKEIVDNGYYSKYGLAKKVGVSWNTVHMWYLGVYEPTDKHKEQIDEISKSSV